MKQTRQLAALLIVSAIFISVSGSAGVPQLISYQRRLTSSVGVPLDTNANVVFKICGDSLGVTELWSETQSGVMINDGLFHVLLGSATLLSESIFNGSKRWLSVQLQGGPAPTALLPMVSVAYAFRSAKSDTVNYAFSGGSSGGGGWTDDGAAVRLTTITDNVGMGTFSPNARLDIRNSNSAGLARLIRNDNQANSDPALWVETNGNATAIFGKSPYKYGLQGSSANSYGIYGTGSKGVYGFHIDSRHYGYLGSGNYGVYGKDSTTGVWGAMGGGNADVVGSCQGITRVGVFGESSSGGVGIRGSSIDSAGVYGSSATDLGVLGTDVRGVYGLHPSSGNFGFLGNSEYGAYGEFKDSTNWGGLGGVHFGLNAYSWNGYGVYARSYNGTGVYGHSNDGTAVCADGWIGDGLYARVGVGSPSYAAKPDGKVLIRCLWDCPNAEMLEVQGNVFLNQNDGELALSTPTQNDPGRYRIMFDNNILGVFCGSDSNHQSFSFMSAWGANRKYDAHLKVHGRTPAGGSWGKYIELYHDGADGHIATDAGDIVMSPASNVGIGTSTPAYKLDVAGSCHATAFPTSSDVRLKTDIQPLRGALDKISKIRGVSFDWNNRYEAMGRSTGHREIGVVAQDVEAVLPELVAQWGEEDYRAVNYGRMTAVLMRQSKS